MTLKTILLFSILAIFSSCNGQNASQIAKNASNDQSVIIAKGDTAKTLGDCLWIIFQDKSNDYWFGSEGQGVYQYAGGTIIRYTTKDGLCNNRIREIQEDKSGNIYFNTVDGISKFDGQTFTTLSATESNPSNNEWKIRPDDLWFQGAQDSGVVYRYDGKSLHRLEFPKTKLGDEFISNYPRAKYPNMTFSPYDVYTIFRDSKGNLWFGTGSLGVCRYDGKSFNWITENELTQSPVRSVFEDKNGNFWFGNSGQSLYRYDGKSVINAREQKGIGNSTDGQRDAPVSYMSITEANNGELWIATYSQGDLAPV